MRGTPSPHALSLGRGVLNWPAIERKSDRYGLVALYPEAEPGCPPAEDPGPGDGPEPATGQTNHDLPNPATGRAGAPRWRRSTERPGKSRQAQPRGGATIRTSSEPQPALF